MVAMESASTRALLAVAPAMDDPTFSASVTSAPASTPVVAPTVSPAAVPVIFVPTRAEGVPRAGVTSVGDVPKTAKPDPVSSLRTPAS